MRGCWIQAGIIATTASSLVALITMPDEGGEVTFQNTVRALYDSNVAGRSGGEDDVVLAYSPTLNFTRDAGKIAMEAAVGGAFGFFADHEEFNYEDFNASLNLKFPNEEGYPYEVEIRGAYQELTDVDKFLSERTQSMASRLDARFRYEMNERWGFGLDLSWSETSFGAVQDSRMRFVDQSIWSAGLDLFYQYSDDLEFVIAYEYYETESLRNSRDNVWSLGMRGQLSPKLNGSFGLGYRQRKTSMGSFSDPYFAADLTWEVTEQLSVLATAQSDYRTTSTGRSESAQSFGLGAAYNMDDYWVADITIGYAGSQYGGVGLTREDVRWSILARLQRNLTSLSAITLSMLYEEQRSDGAGFDLDRFQVGVGWSLSF